MTKLWCYLQQYRFMWFDRERKFGFEIGDVFLSPYVAGEFGLVEQTDVAGAEGNVLGDGAAVRD